MDPNHSYPPLESSQPYSWMRHATSNTVPIEELPTASSPIIYEGFVPEQNQHAHYHNGQVQPVNQYDSAYPPLDQEENERYHAGGPVQPFTARLELEAPESHLWPDVGPSSQLSGHSQYGVDAEEMSIDENESPRPKRVRRPTDAAPRPRGRPRGSGRGGRGGRSRGSERQRGGWNRGTKTGLRPVLDPGEEFKNLHERATEALLEKQNYDEALGLILQAISINPEIHSAHVLLSEIYFARNDNERGIAALFSGAHAAPNDPVVWLRLAEACLEQTSIDRLTMVKQASYCFQRLLQIDQGDTNARLEKAKLSRELGHHAKALKDLDVLLQRKPHDSKVLRHIAEVCVDIRDVGRAIGLYDDALEYHRLNNTTGEDAFNWGDLMVYIDLIARPNGVNKAIQVLKNIARWLLGREEETYWEFWEQDDREWDIDDVPRRSEVPQYQVGRFSAETYGLGLPLDIRVKLGDLRLKSGHRQEALAHFECLSPEDNEAGAPLYEYTDLFLDVADALREIKEYKQALRYYEAVNSVNACTDVDFWLGLGACSYVCEKFDQAMHCYEEARDADPTSGEARTQLSKLYAAKGDRDKALLLARSAITIFESQIPRTERRKYERKDVREAREAAQKAYKEAYQMPKPGHENENMPKPYFSRRARAKARRVAKEAVEKTAAGEEDEEQVQVEAREESVEPQSRQDGLRSREEALKKMNKKRLAKKQKTMQDRYDTIQQLYSTMLSVTDRMRDGDDVARNIWMDCAEALVDEFRTEKAFYPAERYVRFKGFERGQMKGMASGSDERVRQAQEDVPLPSVESTIPNDYCGIVFTNWLDIFLEYAMLLANNQEENTDCYAVISAALDCNVWYHEPEDLFQIYTCYLTCAIALRDEVTVFNTVLRWFMREYIFCTDTYRLFGAANFYFQYPNDKAGKSGQMNNAVFRMGPNQKYLFRQIMGIDSQLPDDYGADQPDGPVPEFMRKAGGPVVYVSDRLRHENELQRTMSDSPMRADTANIDNSEFPGSARTADESDAQARRTFTPKELDAVLLTLYAQVLYAGGSFPNALSYFYRAYTIDPKNSIILLSIALCYMHQMLKRQNENRHMYLLQGWSFFDEYVEARTDWAEQKVRDGWGPELLVIVKKEIEYNRARCWQMLGMSDLAIRSYGKMLDIRAVKTEDEVRDHPDREHTEVFSMEAAYAMTSMYALNGDIDSAMQIAEKYLVVE